MAQRGQITDADVYNLDRNLLGIMEEFQVPSMESETIEHNTLGSVGCLKLPTRKLNALEGSFKLKFPDPDLTRLIHRPNKAVELFLHEKIDIFNGDGLDEENSTVLITRVKILCNKIEPDGNKLGEERMISGEFCATEMMQRFSDSEVPVFEVDFFRNIYKVNGERVWSN